MQSQLSHDWYSILHRLPRCIQLHCSYRHTVLQWKAERNRLDQVYGYCGSDELCATPDPLSKERKLKFPRTSSLGNFTS